MAAEAVAYHPELAGRLSVHRLPEPLPFPDERFEAVFSLATLMHLAPDEIPAVLSECRRVLRAPGSGRGRSAARAPGGGILAVSVPTERPDLDGAGVDERGRRFTVLSRTEWKGLVADAGFEVAESFCSPDAAGREGITWATVIARKA
jgi:SAM-dependent methyltransferase